MNQNKKSQFRKKNHMENVNGKTTQSKDQETKSECNISEGSLAGICFGVKSSIF